MNNTMKNFIYTTIALSILALALIISCIRMSNKINELEDQIEQTYIELQEYKYRSHEQIEQLEEYDRE